MFNYATVWGIITCNKMFSVVLVLHPKTIPDWGEDRCTFNMALFLQVGNIVPMQEISCGTLIFMPRYVHCRHVQHLKKIKGKMARKEALRSRLQESHGMFHS